MKNKKIGLFVYISAAVIFIMTAAAVLVSCGTEKDPFAANTGDKQTYEINPVEAQTYENGYPVDPLEDFYSLTVAESREKYGELFIPGYNAHYAGKYNYLDITVKVMTASGEREVKTLGKCEHLREWAKPACTDPLCTHEHGSACPFANYENSSKMACYCGKLYFWTSGGDLYVYTPETNKSEILNSKFDVHNFCRYDGSLYFIINEEDENFKAVRVAYKVTENGELIRLLEYGGMEHSADLIYKDRYVLIRGYNITEDENGRRKYEVSTEILMYDSQTGKTVTAFERRVPELKDYAAGSYVLIPYMIYGDKLLVEDEYRIIDYDKGEYTLYAKENWLVDLKTFEKKLLISKDNHNSAGGTLYSSEKTILIYDPISDEESHRVIRLIDPYNGTEKVYDLTAAAEKIGRKLPAYMSLFMVEKGAVIFTKPTNDYTYPKILMCDLESGKIYIAPDSE